jgi:hypothetical protein
MRLNRDIQLINVIKIRSDKMSFSKNRITRPVIELFGEFTHGSNPWVTGDKEAEDFLNQVLKFKTRGFWDRKEFPGGYARGLVQMGNGDVVLICKATRDGGYTKYLLENGAVIKTRHVIWTDAVEYTIHLYLPNEKSPACWWWVDEDRIDPVMGHVSFQKKFDGSNADYFPQ